MVNRTELAKFLTSRRARLRPEDVGLPANGRRRTPGLRREETAQLSGISVDHYIRLEQGRGPNPSRQTLLALAHALRLSTDERSYLLRLADQAPDPADLPSDVPVGIQRLLDRLDDVPALVLDARYDILAWNRMATALLGDFSALPPARRNILRWLFYEDSSGLRTPAGRRLARAYVADLRSTGLYPSDPGVRNLVDELCAYSELFTELWEQHEIEVQRSTTKHTVHPVAGEMWIDCDLLVIPERNQRLMFFTVAPGSTSQEALRRLRSLASATA